MSGTLLPNDGSLVVSGSQNPLPIKRTAAVVYYVVFDPKDNIQASV